jgi:hypothetical protein
VSNLKFVYLDIELAGFVLHFSMLVITNYWVLGKDMGYHGMHTGGRREGFLGNLEPV